MSRNKRRYDDERRAKGTKQLQAFDQIMVTENPKPDINDRQALWICKTKNTV
jgi:hypothetical protein